MVPAKSDATVHPPAEATSTVTETAAEVGVGLVTDDAIPLQLAPPPPEVPADPLLPLDPPLPPPLDPALAPPLAPADDPLLPLAPAFGLDPEPPAPELAPPRVALAPGLPTAAGPTAAGSLHDAAAASEAVPRTNHQENGVRMGDPFGLAVEVAKRGRERERPASSRALPIIPLSPEGALVANVTREKCGEPTPP